MERISRGFPSHGDDEFFHARLDQMIDLRHPHAVLVKWLPWVDIEKTIRVSDQ